MSVVDQITRLSNAKAAIKTSIENKGVTVGDDVKLDAYPALIDSIEAGGGTGETYVNPDFYELRTQNGTNFDYLFKNYNGQDIDVSTWDTSKVTSAQYCFSECKKSIDISNWDLSNLTNAYYIFDHFTNGNEYIDLSVLDFSKITNSQYMFEYSNIDYLDVRNINLQSVTDYSNLFHYCYGTELDLSNWDIQKVTSFNRMFYAARISKINLSGWNTINVTNMNYMFYSSLYLETLLIPDWDMTNATSINNFYGNTTNLKYIDLSRSNDLTINKIASFLPKKTATTYGEILVPANTSQDAIDAVAAKYWKPVGPKFDLNSTEVVLELDEIKPGKTTKIWTGNNDPWYGDNRLETIEFISSDESIATVNGREITGVSEGTVTIECRRREDNVVVGSATLNITYSDSKPNLIKFRTNGSESSSQTLLTVNGTAIKASGCTKDPITGIYSYDPGRQITSIKFYGNSTVYAYINEIVKFNFNAANITNMYEMFNVYKGTEIDLSDWDTSKVTDMQYFAYNAKSIKDINGYIDCSSLKDISSSFNGCYNLETLYLKNIYKNNPSGSSIYGPGSIDLGDTKVKNECLIYIINELPNMYDTDVTLTGNLSLTLPPTNTLTAEQVQLAIDKGWTVVNCNF